jgi:cyclopropane fatty-acyl-phospholipid synthase-like methyltransferase
MKHLIFISLIAVTMTSTMFSQHHHDHKHGHGANANEYMHQSSMQELVERFESPERDAYQMPEKVIDALGDLKGKTIMDIGAGSGYFSVKLAKRAERIIAADVSKDFQEFLRDRIAKENIKNITLRLLPFDSPELKEQEVDMVFMSNTYHHIDHRPRYFSKVRSGLKPNGSLVIIDYVKSDIPVGPPTEHKVSIDIIIAELKKAGFTNVDINVNLLPYQFIITAR